MAGIARAIRPGITILVLLVAEKYKIGFGKPLLHTTMYVEKRFSGIRAVADPCSA